MLPAWARQMSEVTTSDRDRTWLTRVMRGEAPPWPAGDDPGEGRRLAELAQAEGVAALCFERLHSRSDAPQEILASLRSCARRQAAWELVREAELRRVLNALAGNQLQPLLLKGAALAYTLYQGPHLRSRCDTDLLFPDQGAADRAWHRLRELGYRRNNAVSGEFISQEFACHHTDTLGVTHTLDIHWKPSNDVLFIGKLQWHELACAAQPVPTLGPSARALAPVHALLLACMHRMQHAAEGQSNRLIWLYDIHLLARSFSPAEWSDWLDLARSKGLCSICLDGLRAASLCLTTPVPASVMTGLTAASAGEWLRPDRFSCAAAHALSALRALPNWRSRCQWAREHLFPAADYMLAKYDTRDARLLPFLYLRRILSGFVRFLPSSSA